MAKTERTENGRQTTDGGNTKYIWPENRVVCPRCRGANTEAYSTKGNIQYRRCRQPVCRWNYSVRARKTMKK